MEPLPEEDVLEPGQVHARIPILVNPLWRLLILIKLSLPFFLARRGQDSVWFPSHHRYPDLVSLVWPPITTIAKILALTVASQAPTTFSLPRIT